MGLWEDRWQNERAWNLKSELFSSFCLQILEICIQEQPLNADTDGEIKGMIEMGFLFDKSKVHFFSPTQAPTAAI